MEVEYLFSIPDNRRRDLGNMFKSTDDFMVGYGVLLDDCLIHKISAEWTTEGNGVLIKVREKNNGPIPEQMPAGPSNHIS